ncbi:MAG: MurT ligase domain-containing protein [Bacilli bacterium]
MSILLGKIAIFLSKIMGNRGTDIGGQVALKINKNIFKKLARNIDHIILVTGTNGKTTTTNIMANIIAIDHHDYIHNKEGANMYTGILTAMIKSYHFFKKNHYSYAIFEVDEGSVARVLKDLSQGTLVINNFFRDQLDRYGEIDIIIDKIKGSIDPSKIKLILNVDDPFCMRFDNEQAIGFGLDDKVDAFTEGTISDSRFCPVCQRELVYTKHFYGQLGHYHCECGFTRKQTKYLIEDIKPFNVTINNTEYDHHIGGSYNAYNIGAAISGLLEHNIRIESIKMGLASYYSQDGRMQSLIINQHNIYLNLVKNPAGMNMMLQEVKNLNIKNICFILNDHYPDGRDVSWIWDADFEELLSFSQLNYFISGTRAYDMALRLKNMGIPPSQIMINTNFKTIVTLVTSDDALIVSSYTALNETKNILTGMVN